MASNNARMMFERLSWLTQYLIAQTGQLVKSACNSSKGIIETSEM